MAAPANARGLCARWAQEDAVYAGCDKAGAEHFIKMLEWVHLGVPAPARVPARRHSRLAVAGRHRLASAAREQGC